ncbi:MAG TPA: Hsp20/alpha crystallin family protein [Acidobacteriota bacterium]|jgi:HSP20 family protein|nr:Hsp20/alpha crystallin family protein [Acidobacteriota bacterium]
MSLMRINPLRELQEVHNVMNRVFGDNLSRFFSDFDHVFTGGDWIPPVDVYETDDDLVFTCELPGFEKDDVNIEVDDGRLILSGKRPVDRTEGRQYHCEERWHGSFYRSFVLPTSVDADKITATLKNGILTVTLPKKAEAKPRRIPVKVQ